MISEQAFETLKAFVAEVMRTEWGPCRERVELMQAFEEVAVDRAAVTVERRRDEDLVAHAIAHHTRAGLLGMSPATRPTSADMWPTSRYAAAQWHLTRAQLLRAAPVEVAAAQLREEAHAALDTNPKEAKE